MSADLQLIFTDSFLTAASTQIFPQIQPKLQQTVPVPDQGLTFAWAVTSPPQFVFTGQDGPQTFRLILTLDVTLTPEGKPPESASVQAVALVKAAIDGNGTLSLRVAQMQFVSQDAFLAAVLTAQQSSITEQVNGLLATIAPTLAIVEGIAFHGFAVDIGPGVAAMAASVNGNASNDNLAAPATAFALTAGQPLVQALVQQKWWNTVTKSYSAHGANISLNGYNVAIANGQVLLTFFLGGSYSIGAADWTVEIDPVTATLNVAVDSNRNVNISNAGMSTPNVNLKPDNWLAYVFDIGLGLVAAITQAIISDVIGNQIADSIKSQLDQTLLQIPVLSADFDGVTITFTPSDITVAGAGNQLLITGNGTASAS